jgi:hypothetical protein
MAQHYIRSAFMSGHYVIYLDLFESQEAWLYCAIFAAYTTLPNKPLHNKLSKSAKHLNSTVTHCITYVCHLTKQAHFFPCKSTITAEGVADMHVQHVFPLHRTPEKIISDCGLQFAAQMTKELYHLLDIEHAMLTSFHLQSNGQTEHTNQEIGKYLCMLCGKDQDNWAKLLPIAEFAYNSHVHSASKASPFELLYGYQPSWASPIGGRANIPSVEQRLAHLHKVQNKAKAALHMAKEAMVQSSKANRSRPTF